MSFRIHDTAASTGNISNNRRNLFILTVILKMEIQTYLDISEVQAQQQLRGLPAARHIARSILLVHFAELETAQPE